MATAAQTTQPTPTRIFETLTAHQQTAALKAAVELDLFTAIGEGATSAAALAQRCAASERGVRILCDYLVVYGFLNKEGNNYGLPLDSATFLDRRSRTYVGSIVRFMTLPELMDRFRDLTGAVRKGGTVTREEGLSQESSIWIEFARSMAPLIAGSADMIATLTGAEAGESLKVLDIAAGHGLFGIAFARKNPNARIVALDWAGVLKVAEENAQRAGVADRVSTLPGSAFDTDFGSGYDVVLLTNFLHHFDVATCETLLRKVHAALKPNGRAATLEFVPNEDRVSPPIPATFSMTMLGMTEHGDAYTFSELEHMFRNAGFARSELHALPPTPQHLIISYR